jgi:hypothetical protein
VEGDGRVSTPTKRTPKKARQKAKPKKRRQWKPAFLKAFAETGMVAAACKQAKVSRSYVYEARQADPRFAQMWEDIEEATTDEMEREAYRRGVEGVDEPVFQGKELVGHVRKFSDTLLIFMLKARKPEKYRETTRHELTGKDGAPLAFADLFTAADAGSDG